MSYSIIALLWRKPGLTPDDFHRYYETRHMPLLLSLTGSTFPLSHTRFYLPRQQSSSASADRASVDFSPTVFLGKAGDVDYDAFASIVFADEAAFHIFYDRLREPAVAEALKEDEEKFLWRERLVVASAGAPCVTMHPQAAD